MYEEDGTGRRNEVEEEVEGVGVTFEDDARGFARGTGGEGVCIIGF